MVNIRAWARNLKRHALLIYFAARDERTPLYVKLLALAVAGYALSPIDLIPDFIPIIGFLDDIILVPLGIALILRLIPDEVKISASQKAEAVKGKLISYPAAVVVIGIWLIAAYFFVQFLGRVGYA